MLLHDIVRMNSHKDDIQDYFIANGINNYIDTSLILNNNSIINFWGKYVDISTEQYNGTSQGRFLFWGISGDGKWRAFWGNGGADTIADIEAHKFTLRNAGFYIDDQLLYNLSLGTISGITGSFKLFSRDIDKFSNLIFYKAEITHNGQVHKWSVDAENEQINYYVDEVLQGQATINGTVLSSQFGSEVI